MAHKSFSRRNLDFTLFEVLNIADLTKQAYFNAHDADTFAFTLDMAEDIANKTMRPNFADSDRNQPELVDGQVKVHQGVHEFVKTFSEAGLMAAPFPNEFGGIQLPKTMSAAIEFVMGSAHNSFVMYTDLTKGAANLILTFGTDEQKQAYLPKMLAGEWLGTMCLTETQAGSSLSDITTMAYPQADGTYKIVGQKIFISAGDHDYSDNIIHAVLARIEGAPKGTKGISLFIVPKFDVGFGMSDVGTVPKSETRNPKSNDVTSIGIYHKMGQKATPAMHLEFGAKNDCTGYLLGEANRGLPQMFLMMNSARLGVGMGGINVSSAAYYASLQYAQERPQGRRLTEKNALGEPTFIINHPDVRRMLLLQKAVVEGGLSLILHCYKYLDLEKTAYDPAEKKRYNDLLELLTPVAKTYGAEMGFAAVNQGLQVLGGYGYTEDFELEQMLRDVRIMSLYEGTTGIQSLALLGRQIPQHGGKMVDVWLSEVLPDVEAAEGFENLKKYAEILRGSIDEWKNVTNHLLNVANTQNSEVFLSDATLYMELFSNINVAWQWLRQATVAQKAIANGQNVGDDVAFYASKIHTMQFYFHYELPKIKGLAMRLLDPTVLTVLDGETEVIL
jgi:alkylation response protein AidB-like acyl-CoA dehydrogenase